VVRVVSSAIAVVLVLALAACGDADLEPGADPASPSADPTKEDVEDGDGPLAQAITDLAKETGVDPNEIDVVAHDPVTWRDGSLGCPEPGMMYTQALVEGYRIVLRVSGQQVSYHGQGGRPPFRCDNPNPNGAVDQP
jgi:hypothetical protein